MGLSPFPYLKKGRKLEGLRGSKKKNEFAELLQIPYRTYLRYETGEREVPDGLLKLAEMLSDQTTQNLLATDGSTERQTLSGREEKPLDRDLLISITKWVRETEDQLGVRIKADKLGDIILMIYDDEITGNEVPQAKVIQLIRLAA